MMIFFFSVSRFGPLTYSRKLFGVRTFSKNHELLAKVANSQNASIIMILQSPNADEGKRRPTYLQIGIFLTAAKKKIRRPFCTYEICYIDNPAMKYYYRLYNLTENGYKSNRGPVLTLIRILRLYVIKITL